MPLPNNKAELLASFDTACTRLLAEIASMPPELTRPSVLDGGVSLCDLIAYQIGWGRLLLHWDALEQQGLSADMPATGFKWNQLRLLAQSFYQRSRHLSLAQLIDQLAALVRDIRLWIDASSDASLFECGARRWAGRKWPFVKWVQVNTIAPYSSARAKIRRWIRANRALAGDLKQAHQ